MKSEKYSFKRISLQIKFLMVLLPVLISSFVISSYISNLLYKKSIIKTGMEFTGYKADQLVKYADLQWEFILSNNLSENVEYINTVKETIKIFAENMITKEGELVLAVLSDGTIDFSTNNVFISKKEIKNNLGKCRRWVDISISDKKMTGYCFYYPPFNWQIFILQESKLFFNTVSEINRQHIFVFLISLFISIILIIFFVKFLTSPLNKVANQVTEFENIESSVKHLEIEYPDEIGELAFEFNIMYSKLRKSYYNLRKIAEKEEQAKKQVLSREIETLEVLGAASDYRDPETGDHIARVSHYSKMLASCIGESESSQELIFRASPLHDLGKLGIPDSLLMKPGRLTEDEFDIIKTHPEIGYNILKNSASWYLRAGGEIAVTHHERYDGTGYPYGLKGKAIPLYGRIVAIADVFDALTSKRPYKDAWPLDKAFDYIDNESGKSFDPEIAEYFIKNRKTVETIFHDTEES